MDRPPAVIALLLLLAASTRIDLVDEVYRIPAEEWRYVEVSLKQQTAVVVASFEAARQAEDIRVALLRREDLDRLRDEEPHGVLAATETSNSGELRFQVPVTGEYAIAVKNDGKRPAVVHLRVRLDFGAPRGPQVTRLPRNRQLAVILVSFALFFGIVTWSARRLLNSIKK